MLEHSPDGPPTLVAAPRHLRRRRMHTEIPDALLVPGAEPLPLKDPPAEAPAPAGATMQTRTLPRRLPQAATMQTRTLQPRPPQSGKKNPSSSSVTCRTGANGGWPSWPFSL